VFNPADHEDENTGDQKQTAPPPPFDPSKHEKSVPSVSPPAFNPEDHFDGPIPLDENGYPVFDPPPFMSSDEEDEDFISTPPAGGPPGMGGSGWSSSPPSDLELIRGLEAKLRNELSANEKLTAELAEERAKLAKTEASLKHVMAGTESKNVELLKLKKENKQLAASNAELTAKNEALLKEKEEGKGKGNGDSGGTSEEAETAKRKCTDLEAMNEQLQKELAQLKAELKEAKAKAAKPAEEAKEPGYDPNSDWVRKKDQKTGRTYYANTKLKLTSWRMPDAGWRHPPKLAAAAKTIKAAAALKKAVSPNKPKGPVNPADSMTEEQRAKLEWVRKHDKKTGRFYYVNSKLRKNQWSPPAEGWRDVSGL
jgi:hypothetical protein